MKTILCLLFIGAAFAAPKNSNDASPRIMSNSMQELLEKFRQIMLTGDPDRNIPVLDPLKLDVFNFDFNTSYLGMSIDSDKNAVIGLSDFVVHNVDLALIPSTKLTFDFTLPKTLIKSELYDFLGMVFHALPIYGKGLADWDIENLYAKGEAQVQVGLRGVYLKDLTLDLAVGDVVSKTTGMLGGGDIDNVINAIIGDLASDFLNYNSKLISPIASKLIMEKLNEQLDGMSLADFIKLILG